ncbi:hypothetical protein JAAARDRAFT_225621 [Jaapia argillacea MUCL 33604]|uniref:Uncharacterized protein n=1 Tax=Jaapia argillacea MUCL 33604 TaxID=933084 RepID=A0A067QBJ4_9AGAM|nr:hypothetical protein JAAARDRAFT_225621 [Jaapia argillacea MUCL 33604]
MIPLIPTLALAFASFICSAFVILRIVLPILPPSPLSRRVPPSEFGLPNFGSLSPADKSHLWLASCDILALALFVWQAVSETLGGPEEYQDASDPVSSTRLWIALTIRQVCLLVVASITLLHVRMGRPISFGAKHWVLWAPTLLIAVTSTAVAGVLAGAGVPSFFIGLTAFSSTVAVLSSVGFGCLIGTLMIIRRNLLALHEDGPDSWPPLKQMEEKPRPSFATEEVDALRDGASWITSDAGSRRGSISAWSFSTRHSAKPSASSFRGPHPITGSHPSIPAKSSFWFNPATPYGGGRESIPPVPPLPTLYRPTSPTSASVNDDPDPFRRDGHGRPQRQSRMQFGSQNSWLSSTSGSKATLSAWSYPTTHDTRGHPVAMMSTAHLPSDLLPSTAVSRPATPGLVNAKVLGGYGYSPEVALAEKGIAALGVPDSDIDVSAYRAIGWLIMIWVPLGLALPYFLMVSPTLMTSSMPSLLLVLSVTLSAPILALNILFRSPLPIPSGLFDSNSEPAAPIIRASQDTLAFDYKRSASVTVVEGRRSGDVWVAKGDAIEGRTKVGRALEMLNPKPKLSVLPYDEPEFGEITPPLPIQDVEDARSPTTPQSVNEAEVGRRRKESKSSSHWSGMDDSLAMASRIMIAQRHYSAIATTLVLPASPEKRASYDGVITGASSGAAISKATAGPSHLRSRSASSVESPRSPVTPPPSCPLPPTPPTVKSRKIAAHLAHKKSYSSGFSFGAIDNSKEIDALSAGVLPLLVPGLRVGGEMKIRKDGQIPRPNSMGRPAKSTGGSTNESLPSEMGGFSSYDVEFSSPEVHSTPVIGKKPGPRAKKTSGHKKHHFSLPSLSLGKDGVHSLTTWRTDLSRALTNTAKVTEPVPMNEDVRRNTVWGGEAGESHLQSVPEERELLRPVAPSGRPQSARSLGHSRVPSDVPSTARASLNTLLDQLIAPPSAASTATLFDFDSGSGPQAESTPHEIGKDHPYAPPQEPLPPLPTTKANRRSSIVYIKSDDSPPADPIPQPGRLQRLSSKVVRPLRPKSSKMRVQNSSSENSADSPGKGLRPLSLLQERDSNSETASPGSKSTRPLTLGKKKKAQKFVDENENPQEGSKGLKPLKLARSDTNKERAVLRKAEVLPDVVVRPPSTSMHSGFAYTFR